jgi:hypothetical protein
MFTVHGFIDLEKLISVKKFGWDWLTFNQIQANYICSDSNVNMN